MTSLTRSQNCNDQLEEVFEKIIISIGNKSIIEPILIISDDEIGGAYMSGESITVEKRLINIFLEDKNFIPKDASSEGTKFFDRIISIAINEISQNEFFDFQQSKVFEIITEEDLNLYFELIPSSLFGSDFIFIQRKIFGLILFFRAIGAKLPLIKILKQQSKYI